MLTNLNFDPLLVLIGLPMLITCPEVLGSEPVFITMLQFVIIMLQSSLCPTYLKLYPTK